MNAADNDGDRFLEVAIAHELISTQKAAEVEAHARQKNIATSDAALETSAMVAWSVDASRLLMNPKDLAPDYELTGILGCGAAGIVFRARQISLNRDVALKTINMLGRAAKSLNEPRIQQEAQAIARLQHPNIVVAYGSGFHNGRFCIAMELVEGQSLADLLESDTSINEDTTWSIIRQAASGLCHADQIGIIHRDIKPGNILLGKPPAGIQHDVDVPFVKIVDFGLALDELREKGERLTVTGATLGTPAYVAPEQLQDTTVDRRADIYSLGATAFHMLTAAAPFHGQSPMKAILQKTIGDESWRTLLPESVSEASVELIKDMTAASTGDRLADYETLLQRIDQLDLSVSEPERLNRPHVERIPSGHKTAVVGAIDQSPIPGRSLSTGRRLLIAAGLLASGLVITIVGWSAGVFQSPVDPFKPESTVNPASTTGTIQWTRKGLSQPLFDGTNLMGQLVKQSGLWIPETTEGTPLLFGSGRTSLLTFPLKNSQGITNVSLTFSAYLESAASELEIRIVGSGSTTMGTIQLKNGLIQYDQSESQDAPTETFEFPQVDPKDVVLHGIEIRREGDRVVARLKGDQLATILLKDHDSCDVIIRCAKDRCGIADISIAELTPVIP